MPFELIPRTHAPLMVHYPKFQKICMAALTVMLRDDPSLCDQLTDQEWRAAEELRTELIKEIE